MKNKKFTDSIKCAAIGMGYAFKTEKNFKYYFTIAVFFLIVNLIVKVSLICHMIYVLACGGVLCCEIINTAIEHLANILTAELDDRIKLVKDISAAAVLLSGIAFFIFEFIAIGGALLG